MDLKHYLDCMLQNATVQYSRSVYKCLQQFTISNKAEEEFFVQLIPKLHYLCRCDRLDKGFVYLTLIALENENIMQKFLNYDREHSKLSRIDSCEVTEYCLYRKSHWFLVVLDQYKSLGKEHFSDEIFKKIAILKLVDATNHATIDLTELKSILKEVPSETQDKCLNYFINEIRRVVDVTDFIKSLKEDANIDDTKLASYVLRNSFLKTLCEYADLCKVSHWGSIAKKIQEYDKEGVGESETFAAFTVLYKILSYLNIIASNSCNIEEALQEVEAQLLTIKNSTLQLQVVRLIFSFMFLRKEHLKSSISSEGFIHDRATVKLLLNFLNSTVGVAKLNNFYQDEGEQEIFLELNERLNHATWKFGLMEKIRKKGFKENPVFYMLSSPQSLVHMCLKQGDFGSAQEVIQMYQLHDSLLNKEIKYALALDDLKQRLSTNDPDSPTQKSSDVIFPIKEFFKVRQPPVEDAEFLGSHELLQHLTAASSKFMEIFDLAVTQSRDSQECMVLMEHAFEKVANFRGSPYADFCLKLKDLYKEICSSRELTIAEVLTSSSIKLDKNLYKRDEDFYRNLQKLYSNLKEQLETFEEGFLDHNHRIHKKFLDINELCNEYTSKTHTTNYLLKLYEYLQSFSKILYVTNDNSSIVSKNKHVSYFEILKYNRALLMGNLLFTKRLNPADFEELFTELKLDFMYHIAGNCFPTINLHKQENVADEEMYVENQLFVPDEKMINYIQKRHWLLAFILNEMYNIEASIIDASEMRMQYFMNYIKLPRIQRLKVIFESEMVTALQNEFSPEKIVAYINRLVGNQEDWSKNYAITNEVEPGEEVLEENSKATNWKELYEIMNSLPESAQKKPEYEKLKDIILQNLVSEQYEENYFKYVKYISNRQLRMNTILHYFMCWPLQFCIDTIKDELSSFESLKPEEKEELETWLGRLEFYQMIYDDVNGSSWYNIHKQCFRRPKEVFQKMLASNKIDFLLQFIRICNPDDNLLSEVTVARIFTFFDMEDPPEKILELLQLLPPDHAQGVCYNLLKVLKKMKHLQFILDYLLQITEEETDLLKNVKMSLKILSLFNQQFQDQMWCLITIPLEILEVLVMNMKLDKLEEALVLIGGDLRREGFEEKILGRKEIDDMLRVYAEKSLDFRVIVNPSPKLLIPAESKLMESLDSFSLASASRRFVLPTQVPSKAEWVSNNEVLECMCCEQSTFSMFNRRHHCRRCGRVVCSNCSTKRMLVPTYGDILVRVCNDCFEQTSANTSRSDSSRSLGQDFWIFTDDPDHNRIVREEFSFEHAPSVSLCLAILKNHSKSIEYPRFLLDQSDRMLTLLYTIQQNAHEIDHALLIKMIKSLATAAKILCTEKHLDWGVSAAAKIVAQADTLGLLIEHACLHLLPANVTKDTVQDVATLRRIRDKLMEDERWEVALEVATKAGLERSGVFAAWGKCYLKAGCLSLAREKFRHCFEKKLFPDTASESGESSGPSTSKTSTSSDKTKRSLEKDPPLLDDIIQILESNTIEINKDVLEDKNNTAAICILNKLKNLDSIIQGKYSSDSKATVAEERKDSVVAPHLQPLFYDECLFYLKAYGSRLGLLKFYIKHSRFKCALNCILESNLSLEIFTEIYVFCLRAGIVGVLQENMMEMDPTFEIWKDYIQHTCRHLEKTNLLHSLYDLQVCIGDYIRAAMSCIMFYRNNAKTFSELNDRIEQLLKAEEHLKQALEQQQWVEVATVGTTSSTSSDNLEERALTHPSIVLKLNPRTISRHINTIWQQIEVTRFLVDCEEKGRIDYSALPDLVPQYGEESRNKSASIPTLFDDSREKLQLAILSILSADKMDVGFLFASKLMHEHKLKPIKVYCLAGSQLARSRRYDDITALMGCIHASVDGESARNELCDEILTFAARALVKENVTGPELEGLIKQITDKGAKISAHIEAKQLKSAYLLAVKYKRITDIRRIMSEAELLNQPTIKSLCQRILQQGHIFRSKYTQ